MHVLVLAGGPDAERAVSLRSGASVSAALREAGHDVTQRDIGREDLSALDQPCDVIFPALHGKWGEGGGLQRLMDERELRYVGATAAAAELCMHKARTKAILADQSLPTPAWEVLGPESEPSLEPPVVIKAIDEGSSLDLFICQTEQKISEAMGQLRDRHRQLLVERFVAGKEITVGVIAGGEPGGGAAPRAMPPIWIRPAVAFYDYEAKYDRDDTRYMFDLEAGDAVAAQLQHLAVLAHQALGARHLSRVDFMLDATNAPWILEVNTMPGFTDHSLLPMAAAELGIGMPDLCDRLVHLAARD